MAGAFFFFYLPVVAILSSLSAHFFWFEWLISCGQTSFLLKASWQRFEEKCFAGKKHKKKKKIKTEIFKILTRQFECFWLRKCSPAAKTPLYLCPFLMSHLSKQFLQMFVAVQHRYLKLLVLKFFCQWSLLDFSLFEKIITAATTKLCLCQSACVSHGVCLT